MSNAKKKTTNKIVKNAKTTPAKSAKPSSIAGPATCKANKPCAALALMLGRDCGLELLVHANFCPWCGSKAYVALAPAPIESTKPGGSA